MPGLKLSFQTMLLNFVQILSLKSFNLDQLVLVFKKATFNPHKKYQDNWIWFRKVVGG